MRERIGVLLVEDNPVDAMLLRESLESVPDVDFALTQVVRLADGQARLQSESYDVVLLDLGLPDSAGPETFSRLQHANPRVPVLVLTGLSDEGVGLRAMQEGAQDYLLKGQLQGALLGRSIRYAIERHRAASQLSRSEARLAGIFGSAMDGIVILDEDARVSLLNPAAQRMFGYHESEVIGLDIAHLLQSGPPNEGIWHSLLRTRPTLGGGIDRAVGRRKDGSEFPVEASIARAAITGERLYTLILRDVTDRVRADELLSRTRDEIQAIVAASPVPIVAVDRAGTVRLWSRAAERLFGWTEAEVMGTPLPMIPKFDESYEELRPFDDPERRTNEWVRRLTRDGRQLEVSVSTAPLRGRDGAIVGRVVAYMDLSQQLALQGALRASEERFALAFQANPSANALVHIAERRIVEVNHAFLSLVGCSRAEVIGQPTAAYPLLDRHGKARIWDAVANAPSAYAADCRLFSDTRGERMVSLSAQRLDLNGESYAMVVLVDITERVQSEASLRESEERFRQVAENIREMFWLLDAATGRVVYASPAFEEIWGRPPEALRDSLDGGLAFVHDEDRERVRSARGTLPHRSFDEEYRIVRPDGVVRWVRDQAFPVRNSDGAVTRVAGVAEDITMRRQLEEQLRQTQRMESIGQLAGGIAHDFNNFLTVISGCTELLLMGPPNAPDTREILEEIRRTSERAASLTRQLLAFSRQDIIESRVTDLNTVVIDTDKILRRLLGEDVALTTRLAPGLPTVRIDPGQWSQVLMNLSVNARDAMPGGGQLTIETKAVTVSSSTRPVGDLAPGRYISLSVSDTGHGMTPDVRARAFEPFFTTKGLGRGTGLGLSVVHGIVAQSRGRIEVDSEPGVGTTIRIYLPAETGAAADTLAGQVSTETPVGTETILIAEDEASIRSFAARALRSAGYSVITAADGAEAITALERHDGPVHLLLTDVVMPLVGGRQVAEVLQARHPELRVIYTSGYTDDDVLRRGVLRSQVSFLPKPYSLATLCRRVREVLDQPLE